MTEGFLGARGIYYRTNDFVAGRPTLVFVHGLSGSSSAWRTYETHFAQECNVLTYDLRGHGRSTKYPRCRDYAVSCFVDDLEALRADLAIESCVLVGHSYAALVVLEYLRRDQRHVSGVVLLGGEFHPTRHVQAKVLRAVLAPVGVLERLPFHPKPGGHIDYRRFVNSGDWNLRRTRADIGNTTWRVLLYCTQHALMVNAEDVLPALRMPVRLVHGRKDTVFSMTNSTEMASRIRDADLIILEDADHILVLNQPRQVAGAIEGLLQRCQAPVPC